MPSTDPNKYILHPFEPLTVPEALLTAVCGLLVVFMMLAILMVVIIVISKVVASIDAKKKPVAAPAKKAAPAPKPAAPAAPAAPAQDEGELVAVMMAAVAEESGMPMGSFQITNIAPAAAAPAPAPVAAAPVAAPAHARQHLQGGVLCGPVCQCRRRPGGAGGHEDGDRGVRPRGRHCQGCSRFCGHCRQHR